MEGQEEAWKKGVSHGKKGKVRMVAHPIRPGACREEDLGVSLGWDESQCE